MEKLIDKILELDTHLFFQLEQPTNETMFGFTDIGIRLDDVLLAIGEYFDKDMTVIREQWQAKSYEDILAKQKDLLKNAAPGSKC